MTLTLDIAPELQVELARQAAARGMALDAYAANLLREAARPSDARQVPEGRPAPDMVELFAPLRGLNLEFERDKDPGRDIRW
jgi:hypothetical protein